VGHFLGEERSHGGALGSTLVNSYGGVTWDVAGPYENGAEGGILTSWAHLFRLRAAIAVAPTANQTIAIPPQRTRPVVVSAKRQLTNVTVAMMEPNQE
jgi:hypothetical protein